MRLKSTDGAEIELRPAGYLFPSIDQSEPSGWDGNWLVIRGNVRLSDERQWDFEGPCMTTWDAAELAGWLRSVAAGAVGASPLPSGGEHLLVFAEPDLGFSLGATGDTRRSIRVHFSLEAAPPWLPPPGVDTDLYSFFVTVRTTVEQLAAAVEEWKRELALFPPR